MRAFVWLGFPFAGGAILGMQALNPPGTCRTAGIAASSGKVLGGGSVLNGESAVGVARPQTDQSPALENQSLEQQIARMERMERMENRGMPKSRWMPRCIT